MANDTYEPARARSLVALKPFLVAGLGIAISLALAATAFAHSWYDAYCCNERDCRPYPEENVRITPEGYRLHDGTLIPFSKARRSLDSDYHVCLYRDGTVRCFYAPVGSV